MLFILSFQSNLMYKRYADLRPKVGAVIKFKYNSFND